MQKISDEKAHAEFSASGSHRWLNCPGSHALSKNAPPQRESAYAAEGTKAHECLEFLLKNRQRLKQAVKTARKTYDEDMVEHALFATDYVLERLADYPNAMLLSETKVDSSPFTCTGQFGTLDVSIIDEFGRLIVIDYKYGAGYAVDPEGDDGTGNPQLTYYALALSHQYHHNFAEVELVVIQPRAFHESGDVVRSFVMSMDDLIAWGPRFREGVMATSDAAAPLKSGTWCKFCPAATICPELKDNALKTAQVVFSDTEGLVSAPEPGMLQLPDLGTVLAATYKLEDWIEKVREHATHVLERGGEVPGFKLVDKRSPRRWTDEERASADARKLFGDSAFTEPRLLSPAQLEKAQKKAPGLDAWVEARVTTASSGTTLVRDSDKRPAVKPITEIFKTPAVELPAPKRRKKEA